MIKSTQEVTVTTLRKKINTLARFSGMKRPSGSTFGAVVDRAVENRRLTLFVPWAAPRGGGKGEDSSFDPEDRTMGWLAGVRESLGELVSTRLVFMFADTYADRNGYDKAQAENYFLTVQGMLETADSGATTVRASQIEDDPLYQGLLSQQTYGLDSLGPAMQNIIIGNAARYTGLTGSEAYDVAAAYTARRRAEALWVVARMGALTVTLNGPNGNTALSGMDSAMMYGPLEIRTPWLKRT